jgi:diketogulonate reductase-like aldo/keto reductase
MAPKSRTAESRVRALADGHSIPLLGFGSAIPNGSTTVNAVRWALELGYRHIDTAPFYGNEESVGRALKESGVPRAELFITTKFWPGGSDPVEGARRSLQRLGVDYVDLYLVHWPQGGATWMWPGMERARELGYTRSIGVSNYDVREIDQVIAAGTAAPVVDQVQLSPFEYRRKLLAGAESRGVAVEAYSPLGTGRHLTNGTVKRLASRVGRTPAQVLVRWSLQKGLIVIPKSTHRDRIEENSRVFDFTLSDEDMAELDALDETGGTERALEEKWW